MKTSHFATCLAILAIGISHFAFTPSARAVDEQQKAATVTLLLSGPWSFHAGKWTNVRTFKKNGSFTTINKPNESGTWRIYKNSLLLTFTDKHQDTVLLPLNASGSKGTSSGGEEMTAILQATATATPASSPSSFIPKPSPSKTTAPVTSVYGTSGESNVSMPTPPPFNPAGAR